MQGPRRTQWRGGGRFVSSWLTLSHSHGNALGSQLPSCPTNKMGSIQVSSPWRKTERGYKTVNSADWAYLGPFHRLIVFPLTSLGYEVLVRHGVAERLLFSSSPALIFQWSPQFIKYSLDHRRCFFANRLFVYIPDEG